MFLRHQPKIHDVGRSNHAWRLVPSLGVGLTLAALLACGGGGGGSTAAAPTPTPTPAPTISTQPASTTVVVGSVANFSVVATGSPTYQWTKGGTALAGATSASYATPATVAADDNAVFAVTATNAGGSTPSANATLHVNYVTISTQPSNASVLVGANANFTVAATGSGTLTYQWQKGGTAISGATSATNALSTVSTSDAGTYTCVVTSSLNGTTTTTTTNAATLSVAAAAPVITTQPASTTVVVGSPATFTVVATGAASYQWYIGTLPIQGATSATYTTGNTIQANDNGVYSVKVTNAGGTTPSANATLRVNYAAVTTQPLASQTLAQGSAGSVAVVAAGSGTLSYQWAKSGTPITGATAATYAMPSVALTDGGTYACTVTSILNGTTTSALSGDGGVDVVGLPAISAQPQGGTYFPGDQLILSVTATSQGIGTLNYQWKKNGTVIGGATLSTYTVQSLAAADAGAYTCVVTNTQGAVSLPLTSQTATVTVQITPGITAQPVNQTASEGLSATFSLVAKGPGPLSYQWYLNGTAIPSATSATYTKSGVALADSGSTLYCKVTNANGTLQSSTVHLTVIPLVPSFTATRTTITKGEGVTFTYLFSTALGTTATLSDGTTPATVTNGGSTTVYPTVNTTYTLSVLVGGVGSPQTSTIPVTVKTYSPKYLYVVNNGASSSLSGVTGNNIYQYPVNAAAAHIPGVSGFTYDDGGTGGSALVGTAMGTPVPTGNGPVHIATTPDEKFFFVANNSDATLSAFTASAIDGSLTALAGSPFTLPAGYTAPWCSASNPVGTKLYVGCAEGIAVFSINATTGALTSLPNLAVAIPGRIQGDLLIHPSGRFLYVADSGHSVIKSYVIDATTGALSVAGTDVTVTYATGLNGALGTSGITIRNPSSIVFDRAGTMLFTRSTDPQMGVNNAAIDSYTVDPFTGALAHKATSQSLADTNTGAYLVDGNQDGWHGLTFSAQPGVDHLYNGYVPFNSFSDMWAAWTVDMTLGSVSYFTDSNTGVAGPRGLYGFNFDGRSKIASGMVRDRSGQIFVLTFEGGDNLIVSYGSDATGNLAPMGSNNGEASRSTGDTPVHAVFTGSVQ